RNRMSIEVEPEIETAATLPVSRMERAVARLMSPAGAAARRTALAIGDQCVVSGTRFLTTALIGRVCGAQELGDYALAFTFYSLTACTQEALVSVPYTIYGNRLSGDERRRFAGSALTHYAMLSGVAASLLAVASLALWWARGGTSLAPVLATLAIA